MVIASLHGITTSTDVIVHLDTHWTQVNLNAKVKTSGTTTVALKANSQSNYNKKICTNPNCGQCGHTIKNCYWRGGGKEGQFPPGFSRRNTRNQTSAAPTSSTTTPTANAAIIETVYMLMAVDTPEQYVASSIPTHTERSEYDDSDIPEAFAPREEVVREPNAMVAGVGTGTSNTTYIDSGASHHYFANKTEFSSYIKYPNKKEGQAATRSSKFTIYVTGTVAKRYLSGNKATTFNFSDALHMPDFAANLISVSKFDNAGFEIQFGNNKVRIIDPNGLEVLKVEKRNRMYIFEEHSPDLNHTVLPAKSHEKPTSIEQWH